MSFINLALITVTVAGAMTTAISQEQQGKQQEDIYNYNAAVQKNSALEAANKAKMTAEAKRDQGAALIARQRVLYAKSGVTQEGTPTELIIGTAGDVEDDAQTILQKGMYEYSRGMEESELSTMEGKYAAEAGQEGAVGTLLTGLARAGSQGMKLAPVGAGDGGGGGGGGNIPGYQTSTGTNIT
jgi:hypothetical protein